GFALFKAIIAGPHGAYGAQYFGLWQCGNGRCRSCCCVAEAAARGHRIQLTATAGGFLGIGGADGAQVVSGLQAAYPSQLVDVIELLARDTRHEYIERLSLVYPFGSACRAFNDPGGIDFEG